MKTSVILGTLALGVAPACLAAQQLPPVRPLGPVAATSTESFGQLVFVRHIKNGVLVNDVANRRLLLLDSTLTQARVVADTTQATANAYSGRAANLIAYRGDSSLFVDANSMSMLVIDPNGEVGRVIAVPRSQDATALGNPSLGAPAMDAAGRLVYRGMPRFEFRRPGGGRGERGGGGDGPAFTAPEFPDTAAIVRVDLGTRVVDTVGFTKVPRMKMDVQRDEATGRVSVQPIVNPLPVVDDWAVLSDGSIAIVRGRDYHIDWVRPDGSRASTPKIPFEWQRLTDEDKVAFIDSVKAARERMLANAPASSAPAANGATVTGPGGEQRQMIVMGGPGGDGPRGGGAGMNREVQFVPPSELPDYKPVFLAGQVRADADGNLWIRTIPTKGVAGGPVYDVVNGKGELAERVQVPANRIIVGFGAGGVVYLLATDGDTRKLERARFK